MPNAEVFAKNPVTCAQADVHEIVTSGISEALYAKAFWVRMGTRYMCLHTVHALFTNTAWNSLKQQLDLWFHAGRQKSIRGCPSA